MKKTAFAVLGSLMLGTPLWAAENPPDTALQALDARIRVLEAEGQKLREQAAAALAAADAARAELEKMKAAMQSQQQAQATAAVSAPREAAGANPGGANGNAFNPG